MKKFTLWMFGFALALSACQRSAQVEQAERVIGPNDSLFKVQQGPYQFSVCLPKDMMVNYSPSIQLNAATGDLEITLGERFHLIVTDHHQDHTVLRQDLNTDALFTNKLVEEDNASLMYEQLLPTGESYSYQFCKNISAQGHPYFIHTSPSGEYTLEAISRMKQVVSTIGSI